MENNIEIQKEDLKQILLKLVNKIDKLNQNIISLNKDLYWNISSEELYNVYEEPKEISIGSLKDDWDFLEKLLENEREVIGYDFNKMSNVLRFIGETIN